MDDARFDVWSRRLATSELQEGEAAFSAAKGAESGKARRRVLGSLGAAGLAMFAGLGLQKPTAKKEEREERQVAAARSGGTRSSDWPARRYRGAVRSRTQRQYWMTRGPQGDTGS